jgi:hypothetical protein
MKIEIIIPIVTALVMFAAYGGLIIRWEREKDIDKKSFWSKCWHRIGLGLRIMLWLAIFLASNRSYADTGMIIVLSILEYNISINLIIGLKWWSVGTTAETDKLIRKLFPHINW